MITNLFENPHWVIWALLSLVILLALYFVIKCVIKLGYLFLILLILGAVVLGIYKIFPEESASLLENVRSYVPILEKYFVGSEEELPIPE